MKKILTITLALILCAAMTTMVFAASPIESIGGTDTKDVKGTFASGGGGSTVYSVDVSWGAMEFTYTSANAGTWDPSNHTYTGTAGAAWSWTNNSNNITVTNHSNTAVTAELGFANAGGAYASITGAFYDTSTTAGSAVTDIPLATADGVEFESAPTGTAYFRVTGGTLATGTGVTIGTITVTLD